MGVMFDIKTLDNARVLDIRADLSVTKDKDKEQRKRCPKVRTTMTRNRGNYSI